MRPSRARLPPGLAPLLAPMPLFRPLCRCRAIPEPSKSGFSTASRSQAPRRGPGSGPRSPDPPEQSNEASPYPIDSDNKTIRTAVGDLPLSPIMDPSYWEATTHQPKAKPGKPQNSLERQFRANSFAQALATPIRLCPNTGAHLPSFFLLDFQLVRNPDSGQPWMVPRDLARHSAPANTQDEGDDLSAEINPDSLSGADPKSSATDPTIKATTAASETLHLRQGAGKTNGPAGYALARLDMLQAMASRDSGLLGAHKAMMSRSGDRWRSWGIRSVWRQDMGDFILSHLRRYITDQLLYLSNICATEKRYYLVRCYGWDDIKHKHIGAVLWFGEENGEDASPSSRPAPGSWATYTINSTDIKGEPMSTEVPVHNMPMLLGPDLAARLKRDSPIFKEGNLFMLARRRSTDLQLLLWKMQGYLADYSNIC